MQPGRGAEVGGQAGFGIEAGEHVVDAPLGDSGDVGADDRGEVHGDGQGHAVEVAAAEDVGGLSSG